VNNDANSGYSLGGPRGDQPSLISLEKVVKCYGRQRVLDIASLTIQEGDRLMICGVNGSGKSTLLRLLGGIARPQRGTVNRAKVLQSEVMGYVPQSAGLYAELSVHDNFLIRRRLYGRRDEDPTKAWYVRELGLIPLLNKRFGELSGGFQRLTAIAAALSTEPSWLLFDEPLAGIDSTKREVLLSGLAKVVGELRLLVISVPIREDFPHINRWIGMEEGRISWQEP
jgi:ABC-type multidrug transport system ATPase subunit